MNSLLNFVGTESGLGNNNTSAYIEIDKNIIIIDCGFTVFNQLKEKIDFNKYDKIDIIITHMHNDHCGSLSQLILYLWFVYGKKTTVISMCKDIKQYLKITGTTEGVYTVITETENIKFIKTEHVKEIDCYGFIMKLNNKTIVYTGDTKTIQPFLEYLPNADELYIDVSKNGDVHIKFEEIIDKLIEIKNSGVKIYLMHVDDYDYIRKLNNNQFYFA